MRFLITWSLGSGSEAEQARILALFAKWEPPIELKEWSGFADGDGGMCIVEADTVEQLAATIRAVDAVVEVQHPAAAADRTDGSGHVGGSQLLVHGRLT